VICFVFTYEVVLVEKLLVTPFPFTKKNSKNIKETVFSYLKAVSFLNCSATLYSHLYY